MVRQVEQLGDGIISGCVDYGPVRTDHRGVHHPAQCAQSRACVRRSIAPCHPPHLRETVDIAGRWDISALVNPGAVHDLPPIAHEHSGQCVGAYPVARSHSAQTAALVTSNGARYRCGSGSGVSRCIRVSMIHSSFFNLPQFNWKPTQLL